MDGTSIVDFVQLIKAEQKNDEIYIYDNYIREECDGGEFGYYDNIYATSDNKNRIKMANLAELEPDYELNIFQILQLKLNLQLPEYKHTFKKATNGEYYWVSTELVNKADLTIIK